jgi:transposase
MDARTRFETRLVGALPMAVAFLETLEVAKTIDELVPWEGEVPLGILVEILILNRLLSPTPLFRVGEWARETAVTEYYGLTEEELNDDRLGRALERLFQHRVTVQAGLVANAVKKFRLDVRRIHYDISNVELFGNYERQLEKAAAREQADGEQEEGESAATEGVAGPQPKYGRTKSGRKNVKQIQFGINVLGDGAVPVGVLPLDGNTAEVNTHLRNLKLLEGILPHSPEIYIADTKLDAPENLLGIAVNKGKFVCGGVFQPRLKKEFRKLRREKKFQKVDYCPKSKLHLPEEKRPKYQVAEVPAKLDGHVDGRPVCLRYRLIYVWSEAKAAEEAKTRERHVAKIGEEFEKVERNLNKYSLTTEKKIVARLEGAKNRYDVGEVFQYQLRKNRQGEFSLSWKIDQAALRARQEVEGGYVLKTNLSKKESPATRVLEEYKEQTHVERRIRNLKGPLAVAPMMLEKPERMGGLLLILMSALMVMALMERAVRRSLKGKPMYGLYPENRPSAAPTAKLILGSFSTLCIVIIKDRGTATRRLADLTDVQRKLLRYMGIPPNRLAAFKRKCCGVDARDPGG